MQTYVQSMHMIVVDQLSRRYWMQCLSWKSDFVAKDVVAGIHDYGEEWQQFWTQTEFSSPDHEINNKAWSSFTTTGFVALPHTWAAEQNLPEAGLWPDDPSKGVYVVDGFHQIHCVVSLLC